MSEILLKPEDVKPQEKLCECGCGLPTVINRDSRQFNRFILGHAMRGKKLPKELRDRISKSKIGKKKSVETRENMSKAQIGRKVSAERKWRAADSQNRH